jgi:septal ring factor EnvC (AmiA/AmiB activator)
MIPAPARQLRRREGEVVKEPASLTGTRSAFIPPEFHDVVDVAECALDEQLEQLQRRYAAASRAAARARCEFELLERRDDIHPHILEQARRQRSASETRSQQLLRAMDALEDRLEDRGFAAERGCW